MDKINIYITSILCSLILVVNAFSQSISNDGFINYTVGNKWKYESKLSNKEFTTEIRECTETDALITCQIENFGELFIQEDSVFATDFFSDAGASGNVGIIKFYLANYPVDAVWNACWDCFGFGSEAIVFDTTSYEVFGEKVHVKHININEFLAEEDTIGNPVVQLEIAEKYGILSIQYYEGDALVLTGAVIEGEEYGSLVVSNESKERIEDIQNFSLSPAYPNPFNPDVGIELLVIRPEEIQVQVFDVLGRLVWAIPPQRYSTGSHHLRLGLGHLQTGIFYIIAQSPSQSKTRKITKLK